MNTRIIFSSALILIGSLSARGQKKPVAYDLYKLAENHQLKISNRDVSSFSEDGKRGIQFSAKEGDGVAFLDGVIVADGTIELDIKGRDLLQKSFVGVAFHGEDEETLDAIYFRPFNFQSSDPIRKIHSVQYVSHPAYTWNKLRDEHNGKYEKAITPSPKGTDWFHVKIVLKYPLVTVYVNHNPEPSLTIEQLSKRKTGKIGLWVGNNSDGHFSNLQITPSN